MSRGARGLDPETAELVSQPGSVKRPPHRLLHRLTLNATATQPGHPHLPHLTLRRSVTRAATPKIKEAPCAMSWYGKAAGCTLPSSPRTCLSSSHLPHS